MEAPECESGSVPNCGLLTPSFRDRSLRQPATDPFIDDGSDEDSDGEPELDEVDHEAEEEDTEEEEDDEEAEEEDTEEEEDGEQGDDANERDNHGDGDGEAAGKNESLDVQREAFGTDGVSEGAAEDAVDQDGIRYMDDGMS